MIIVVVVVMLLMAAEQGWSGEVRLWIGDHGDLTSQLTPSSFGRDAKLGVPCLDAACTMGLN